MIPTGTIEKALAASQRISNVREREAEMRKEVGGLSKEDYEALRAAEKNACLDCASALWEALCDLANGGSLDLCTRSRQHSTLENSVFREIHRMMALRESARQQGDSRFDAFNTTYSALICAYDVKRDFPNMALSPGQHHVALKEMVVMLERLANVHLRSAE